MTIRRRHAAIALGSAALFSLLQLTSIFQNAELAVYDIFLRLRPERERTKQLVLLDVDDTAVAQVGEWPWPRSVMAAGLLRLKEFGAAGAVFDIEYINSSPKGVDTLYLQRGLDQDFQRSFGDIASNVSDLFNAMAAGQIGRGDAAYYAGALGDLIGSERDALLQKTSGLIRDNDDFLGQAARLFGKAWATVNLQQKYRLPDGPEADRRARAAERFSYPVSADGPYAKGDYVDVLAPIPQVLEAAKGAGFTNVYIDAAGGVRRRIELARQIDGNWYLQLVFAPLMDMMGRPALSFERRSLKVSGALMPDGTRQDFSIPLDPKGRMLIDWPKAKYEDSYKPHFSFAHLAAMEQEEARLDEAVLTLASMDIWSLSDAGGLIGSSYARLVSAVSAIDAADEAYKRALDDADDAAFGAYLAARADLRALAETYRGSGVVEVLAASAASAAAAHPDMAEYLAAETARVRSINDVLGKVLANLGELRNKASAELSGKLCILGWVGTGTTDIGVNPFDGEYINVGTHAAVADTILSRSFIRYMDPWVSILLTIVVVPLLVLIMGRFSPGVRAAFGFGGSAAILVGSFALFATTSVFVGPLAATLGSVVGVVIREAIDFMGTEREKRFLRKAFGTYLSGDVVEQIISDPSKLKLGGSKRSMTALFTDIRGFSTISEQLTPEALVSLLNRYLSGMSDTILDEKGTIDKYEGDAIIAFFGAPMDLPDHAMRACRSAILMKRLEREMNVQYLAEGLTPSPLATRIGINTGDMVVGNMGTERKMNYTIMGNAVNLAARLEGVNKQYGSWILVSQATLTAAGPGLLARRMDRVRVVGINEPVQLYEILDTEAEAGEEAKAVVESFHKGMDAFEAKEWSEAKRLFKATLQIREGDGPSGKYLERCEKFLKTPPAANWDGVFSLTEK